MDDALRHKANKEITRNTREIMEQQMTEEEIKREIYEKKIAIQEVRGKGMPDLVMEFIAEKRALEQKLKELKNQKQ